MRYTKIYFLLTSPTEFNHKALKPQHCSTIPDKSSYSLALLEFTTQPLEIILSTHPLEFIPSSAESSKRLFSGCSSYRPDIGC
jgi:hypothetical protein